MNLGLTNEEEDFVRATARTVYKVNYLNAFDNAFTVARAIKLLRERFYGSGRQGGFDAALIAYGYVNHDGSHAIDPAIRSNLNELLEHETDVREWWFTVSEKTKRNWLSPSSIYRHWKQRTP